MSDELEPYQPPPEGSPDGSHPGDQLTPHVPRTCEYCHAELSPHYYFCPRCATPYKPVETLLPQLPQPYIDDEMRIRYQAPQAMNVYLIFLGVLFFASTIGYVSFGETGESLHIFISLVLVITTAVMTTFHWRALKVQFAVPGINRAEFFIGFPILAALLCINYFYHEVFWTEIFDFQSEEDTGYEKLIPSYAGRVILVCIVPGIIEEIAFRGLIQHWLHVAITPLKAIVLASILFSAAHFSIISAPYLFAVGVLLGWLRWKTGSLYPSMILHFLHNFVVITYF